MKRTKDEVIGIAFSKLKPKNNEVFADIGCYSCKVSAFFSPYVKKVYAVDVNLSNVDGKLLKECKNIELIQAHGVEFLETADDVDLIFFGGTDRIEEMIKLAFNMGVSRCCISAARMEVAVKAKKALETIDVFREILAVNIWRGYNLAGYTAFRPINPVFLVFGHV
jgi:precorrin-6B methylase 2